jgi:hypothetical protein
MEPEGLCKFWTNQFYYSQLIFIDNMMSHTDLFRQELLSTLKDEKQEEKVARKNKYKEGAENADKKNGEMIEVRTPARVTISVLYKLLLDTMAIVNHKTFIDENWVYMWERFYVLSNFFKNCCENKCREFKLFYKDFQPVLYSCPNFNKRNFKVVFDWYVHLESF